MSKHLPDIQPRDVSKRELAARVLADAARVSVLAVVAAAPWLIAGVQLSVQRYLFTGLLVGLFLWVVSAFCATRRMADHRVPLPLAVVIPIAALALGAIQLLPSGHHDWVTERGSQNGTVSSAIASASASESRDRIEATIGPPRLSQYPASTRVVMARMVMGTIAFCLGAFLFHARRTQLWLWWVLAVTGGVLAFFGIVQKLSWNGQLFWSIPLTAGGIPFGPFVNRNNASGFLNICLAGAIGCVIWAAYCRTRDDRRQRLAAWKLHRGDLGIFGRFWLGLVAWIGQLHGRQLTAVSLAALIVAGVICSLSRGGISAMLLAGAVVLAVFLWDRRRYVVAIVFVLVVFLGVRLVEWVGFFDDALVRLATLTGEQITQEGRLFHWRDAVHAVNDFPLLGTGLGTYRYAYQPYQTRLAETWFYNADNQYVETLVESGILGLFLALAGIVLIFLAICGLLSSRVIRSRDGIVVIGLFALASQSLQAGSDFGLILPANMLAFSLICGAVAGRAAHSAPEGRLKHWVALPRLPSPWVRVVLSAGLLVSGTIGLREIWAAASAQAAYEGLPASYERLKPLDSPTSLTVVEVDDAIEHMTRALNHRPDHAELHRCLAELWIYRYRISLYPMTPQQPPANMNASDWQPWHLTHISVLHGRANSFARAQNGEALRGLRADPLVAYNLRPALHHLFAAQAACPILPGVDLSIAALQFLLDDSSPAGEGNIRRAVLLKPGDADALFIAGLLAHQTQQDDLACSYWRRSLTLTPRYLTRILDFVGGLLDLEFKEVVGRVLPEDPELLLELAATRYVAAEHKAERQLLLDRAAALTQHQTPRTPESQWHYLNARNHQLRQQFDKAIESYRRALRSEPTQVEWRLELAQLLRDQGRLSDAHDEARVCASLDPQDSRVRQLIIELNRAELRQLSAEARRRHPE